MSLVKKRMALDLITIELYAEMLTVDQTVGIDMHNNCTGSLVSRNPTPAGEEEVF